jgi:hypothetical protein
LARQGGWLLGLSLIKPSGSYLQQGDNAQVLAK